MAPLVCALYDHKVIEAVAVHQNPTFEAALTFARAEGFLPAPEAAHAIRTVIDEALRCKASGDRKVIAFNFCGHGHFDLSAYERYMTGSSRTSSTRRRRSRRPWRGSPRSRCDRPRARPDRWTSG